MKSFSNDVPTASSVVSKDEHEQFKTDLTAVLRSVRNWMFGLAAFNLVVTLVVLAVALHH